MLLIPKVVGVLTCGVVLCLGLSQGAQALDGDGATRLEQAKVIKGDLVRTDYGDYIVKDSDGKEVRVHMTKKTMIMGQVSKGDRVEVKIDEKNNALSMRSLP